MFQIACYGINNVSTVNIMPVIHCIVPHYFISVDSCCECNSFYVILNELRGPALCYIPPKQKILRYALLQRCYIFVVK